MTINNRTKLFLALIIALFTLVLATTLSSATPAVPANAGGTWQIHGNGAAGGFYEPIFNPLNPDELYMIADMSGVYHSTNFGQSWDMLPFTEITGAARRGMQFTNDPDILYGIRWFSFEGVRYPVKSTDGGQTFAPLTGHPYSSTSDSVETLFADPHRSDRLLLSNETIIKYSDDGGNSFQAIPGLDTYKDYQQIAGVVWDGDDIFMGTSFGLWQSQNGGTTFTQPILSGISANEIMVSFTGAKVGSQRRFFAVTVPKSVGWSAFSPAVIDSVKSTLYRLDWGSGSWVKVGGFESSNQHRPYYVAMAENNIDTVYFAGLDKSPWERPAILKSSNGGTNWAPVFLTDECQVDTSAACYPSINNNVNQNIATGWGGFVDDSGDHIGWSWSGLPYGFSVALTNSERLIFTGNFPHVSDDGGDNWHAVYVKPADLNPAGSPIPPNLAYEGNGAEITGAMWLDWADADTIFAGVIDTNGMWSNDGGASWVSKYNELPNNTTYQVVRHPNGTLYAATAWLHDVYFNYGYLNNDNDPIDDSVAGTVSYSNDNGATWQNLHTFTEPVVTLAIDPNDSDALYVGRVHGVNGGLSVTHNLTSGATFSALPSPSRTEGNPFIIHVLNDGTLVTSWSGRSESPDNVWPPSSLNIYDKSGIFMSTDGGQTWIDRSHANMHWWTKDVVIDPHDASQNTWYVGVYDRQTGFEGFPPNGEGGLYRTTDRGLTWTLLTDFNSDGTSELVRVESIGINPANGQGNEAYVSTKAQGLWYTSDLNSAAPTFTQVTGFPFRHPFRIFYNPYHSGEVWVTTFGGGIWSHTPAVPTVVAGGRQAAQVLALPVAAAIGMVILMGGGSAVFWQRVKRD